MPARGFAAEARSEGRSTAQSLSVTRVAGICFGVGTQILFLYTAYGLLNFLRFGTTQHIQGWAAVDIALAVTFAIPHSILLLPPVQKRLKAWLAPGLMGCVHCATTCFTLLIPFRLWGGSDQALRILNGWSEQLVLALFYASWLAMICSLFQTGMGYQTGLTQWWYRWRKEQPPARPFITSGMFRWMRHPVSTSFLGLIWFTPQMTVEHLILTVVRTACIYVGSYPKDRRLRRFLGPAYQRYGERVPGSPLIGFGSLNRYKTA
jgi:protein-S-isoprenylcysteine O-methyltransferase Ste14